MMILTKSLRQINGLKKGSSTKFNSL